MQNNHTGYQPESSVLDEEHPPQMSGVPMKGIAIIEFDDLGNAHRVQHSDIMIIMSNVVHRENILKEQQ
jgi:hypothetical protein